MRALPYATAGVLALAMTLAACGPKQEAATAPAEATPPPAVPPSGEAMSADAAKSGDMSKMDMSADAKMATGTGTVTAVDPKAGTITLDHGPIPEANWPAMTMAFKATPPTLLDTVKVGDKVAFDLKLADGSGEVTAIRKQ
ncbi:MAG: copper-binding protein [Phenylobacterium sp.]|uniref:copper-binding protein n=1 Tax=Phenylobacterium sp. TaxID=1871053 RepID=UPI002735113D|nr:copper-binding protein [Phenylobacterium sp.]MDP3748311.1 copper-binding protein [Phenylobacterium sp.]